MVRVAQRLVKEEQTRRKIVDKRRRRSGAIKPNLRISCVEKLDKINIIKAKWTFVHSH